MDIYVLKGLFDKRNIIYKYSQNSIYFSLERCPFCLVKGHHRNDQFTLCIYPDSNQFHCFRCGSHGSIDFLLKILGINLPVLSVLKNRETTSTYYLDQTFIPIFNPENNVKIDFSYIRKKYEIKNYVYQYGLNYLKNRGFDLDFILDKVILITNYKNLNDENNLNFGKRFFGRIVIPDFTYTGFTARDFLHTTDKTYKLRYLSSSKVTFFGNIVNNMNDLLYITEGAFDSLKLNQLGYNSFATGGKSKILSFLKNNKEFLSKYKLVLMIEADVQLEEDLIKTLFLYIDKVWNNDAYYCDLSLTPFKDPADFSCQEHINNLIKFNIKNNKEKLLSKLLRAKKSLKSGSNFVKDI